MYDGPYNSKTLPLVWRVVALNLVVTSRCIGDNIFLVFLIKLAKNSTNIKSILVNVYNEDLVEIKSYKNGEL
jgi:hypothetical protein